MAPSRLTDSQKQELLRCYRAGESSAVLAVAFGCSPNTVSRTVRTQLTPEQYRELKLERAGATAATASSQPAAADPVDDCSDGATVSESTVLAASSESPDDDGPSTLALDDADDFGDDDPDDVADDDAFGADPDEVFQEVAVLPVDLPQVSRKQVSSLPFAAGVLPDSVYMLVDKTVELDPRPVSDFPELGVVDPEEQSLQALCLYASPRSAKRQCGRSQRVIKVPDTQVFERTTRYLIARGITRLVLEGALYALDA